MQRMKKHLSLYLLGLLVIVITGCSGYEKVLKGSDYKLKYSEAMRFYQKQDYVRAATLFDQIASVYRGTDQADTIYFFQAQSYFKQNDYILSGHYFRTFARTYGASTFAEEAEYMGAFCYYMTSPGPELDQDNTVQAIQAFQLYILKYPNSDRTPECKLYLDELKNKLVEKSYISSKLYFNLEYYKSALVSLNNSLIEYPDSKYREEIMFMLLKSSYMLASKSVIEKQKERYQDAVDEYYSFIAEYPNSKYAKEANKYYKLCGKYLGDELTLEEKN
jgi:outer membrane protein assembly factor BamD